jgi:hypothetical protein
MAAGLLVVLGLVPLELGAQITHGIQQRPVCSQASKSHSIGVGRAVDHKILFGALETKQSTYKLWLMAKNHKQELLGNGPVSRRMAAYVGGTDARGSEVVGSTCRGDIVKRFPEPAMD